VRVRIDSAHDLGLYIRDQRRRLGLTQADLSTTARVSRRWLSDLEAGKSTVELGLVFRVLDALELILEAGPIEFGPDDINLDDIVPPRRQRTNREPNHG
jgi:HTH-type transcriptional regulator/antitoxin HipB